MGVNRADLKCGFFGSASLTVLSTMCSKFVLAIMLARGFWFSSSIILLKRNNSKNWLLFLFGLWSICTATSLFNSSRSIVITNLGIFATSIDEALYRFDVTFRLPRRNKKSVVFVFFIAHSSKCLFLCLSMSIFFFHSLLLRSLVH